MSNPETQTMLALLETIRVLGRELRETRDNLTATQRRCTELTEENRRLRLGPKGDEE